MKRILIPTDFSEQSRFAMDLACQIALKTNSELIVIHVLDHTGLFDFEMGNSSFPILGNPTGLDLDLNKEFLDSLYRIAEEKYNNFLIPFEKKNLKITSKIKVGSIFYYITEEIKNSDINLLIIGSNGSGGIEEALIGSNTEKVVRHSKCPVLTVKQKTNIHDINDIVFATNFKIEDAHVAEEIMKLQEVFEAKLHLVRVNTPTNFETNREFMAHANEFIKKNKIENFTINIYSDKIEEDGIVFFAQDINADLIALATHGRSGLLHLLSGSIAEDVVNHAKRPVWTFRLKH